MNLSYWEIKSWLTNVDYIIVGSGIVGLSCAVHLKQKYPLASILVLEKGILPQGAISPLFATNIFLNIIPSENKKWSFEISLQVTSPRL